MKANSGLYVILLSQLLLFTFIVPSSLTFVISVPLPSVLVFCCSCCSSLDAIMIQVDQSCYNGFIF